MHGLRIIWDFISHFDNLFQILKMKLQKSLTSLKVMSDTYKLKCVWQYFYLKWFFYESVFPKNFRLKTFYIITTKRIFTDLAWANVHLFLWKKNKNYLNNVIKRLLLKKKVYETSYFSWERVFSMTWFRNQ